ncbi:MAG: OmpH family outer membrane protein [Verrucomicrobiae bacterium]|nr:OmpH family outer membrane protein [Verrucomicrobiae bacterium]
MKKTLLVTLAALTLSPFASGLMAQAKSAAPLKLGTVDIGKALENYSKRKDAEKTLQSAVDGFQKDRKDLETEIAKMREEGAKLEQDLQNPALDEKTKSEKMKAVQEKRVQFSMKLQQGQEMMVSRERQLTEQRGRLMENLITEIMTTASEVGKAKGYNLILDKTKGRGVILDETGMDITDDVIVKLNTPKK